MDLEHPAISRTLKEGYPDGTGKPQQTITVNPNYNRVEEDEQMKEELLTELMLLCVRNGLDFNIGLEGSAVYIHGRVNEKAVELSHGYIKDWEHNTPEEELSRMIKETRLYLEEEINESI